MMKTFFQKGRKNLKAGFTLVELLVTIVIFVLLTSVVLFSQTNFDNTILLNNLAYDIALTIRQAQSYGVGARESSVASFPSYGVYFDKSATLNKGFILYADTTVPPQKVFTGSVSCPTTDPECVQKYSITRGSYISSVCVGNGAACDLSKVPTSISIYFQTPNPDAAIYINPDANTPYDYAEIHIRSASGAEKIVVVTGVGQIYVK